MYNVLIIDDEPAVQNSLSTAVHWQQFGVDTVLTASDGYQALNIMARNKIDLLITDIQMPHMDGITLLEEVRSSYPDTHCIILTAFTEFEYARAAVRLGVENFLLKPLVKEELEETIEKALNNIYSHKSISRQLFRDNILLRWANGNITSEELSDRSELLGLNLYLAEYCTICIGTRHDCPVLSSYCNICLNHLSDTYKVQFFRNDHDQPVFIIGGKQIRKELLITCFQEEAVKMGITYELAIAIGSIVTNADTLFESYRFARHLLTISAATATGLFLTDECQSADQKIEQLTQELEQIYLECEDEVLEERLILFSIRLYDLITENPLLSITDVLSKCLFRLFSQEFPNQSEVQEQLYNRIRLLPQLSNKEDFIREVTEVLKYSHLLFCFYIEQLSPIIQSALRYIHKNYMECITIQDFCVKAKINPAYLGYLFKKETGMFFNNYLVQYRICCSIHLLLDTDMKIGDIAAKVGFSHSSYYNSCFKKQTGISPIKYRAGLQH